jgi:hypothetical protein
VGGLAKLLSRGGDTTIEFTANYASPAGRTGNVENSWKEPFFSGAFVADDRRVLVTVEYGKTKLKDPADALAEVNRRVQVVNMEDKAVPR